MFDKNPAPDDYHGHCRYCGRKLIEPGAVEHVSEIPGHLRSYEGFCSEQCAKNFEALSREEREESAEEIHRAGAT